MPRRIVHLLASLGLFLAFTIPRSACAQQNRVTDEQIQDVLKQAVGDLRRALPGLDGGPQALVTLALLKSGLPAETPEVKAAIGRIVNGIALDEYKPGPNYVYEASVSLMALANADSKAYKPQIAAITNFIIAVQRPTGEWDYPSPGNGDTSISQYAILALWEAARSGIVVPKRVWDKAASWHISRQLADGSFTYHPSPPSPDGFTLGMPGSHTMTCAGTASLLVARLHLYPNATDIDALRLSGKKKRRGNKFGVLIPVMPDAEETVERKIVNDDLNYKAITRLAEIDKAVGRGKKWLDDQFTIVPQTTWDMYYLYGLERLAALAGIKEFNDHDWYAEGAAHLVKTHLGGTWTDGCGKEPATAFGIMFLGKATAKMLGRKAPQRAAKFGGGLLIGGRGLPEDLSTLQVDQGVVQVRKLKGPVDELLAELENAQSRQIESAQAAIVEKISLEDPEALIGQAERLLKLARDKRVEVRRTVFWALGRTNDMRVVPTLINGLNDPDDACMIESRNALRFISKRIDVAQPPDGATDEQRATAIAYWKKWYLNVRPYDERDDLEAALAK